MFFFLWQRLSSLPYFYKTT